MRPDALTDLNRQYEQVTLSDTMFALTQRRTDANGNMSSAKSRAAIIMGSNCHRDHHRVLLIGWSESDSLHTSLAVKQNDMRNYR